MKRAGGAPVLLLLLLAVALASSSSAFTHPQQPRPLRRRQNAMRMSYRDQESSLTPPADDELDALDQKLSPSIATLMRLASTVVIGGAYFTSPVMGACAPAGWLGFGLLATID
jgi:hypothetical protein